MNQLFYRVVKSLVLVGLVACQSDPKKQEGVVVPYTGPQVVTQDMQVLFTDSARVTMRMTAKIQTILQNDDQEYQKGLFVTFFDENQKKESTIKADYAYFFKAKNEWKVTGNVEVLNIEKQQKLETQEMYWYPDKGDILVLEKDSVRITEPDQILWGNGLQAKDDFSTYKIKNVRGTKYLD